MYQIIYLCVKDIKGADMRIVPLGSGGAIPNLEWFLNYCGNKLVSKASEIERKDGVLA
jgi:hypothetical protein